MPGSQTICLSARREIERALELNPGLADAWAELGLIQTRSKEHERAEQSLTKALTIAPEHYEASVNLATLYARTKDPRREAQAAKVSALIEQREARAQQFLGDHRGGAVCAVNRCSGIRGASRLALKSALIAVLLVVAPTADAQPARAV